MRSINFFRLLVYRILIMGGLVMLWSYITEIIQLSGFFGDKYIQKYTYDTEMEWVWGYRHYVWTTISSLLVAVEVIRTIGWASWYWDKQQETIQANDPNNRMMLFDFFGVFKKFFNKRKNN